MSLDADIAADPHRFHRLVEAAEASAGPIHALAEEAAGTDISELRLLRRTRDRAVFAADAAHTVLRVHGDLFDQALSNREMVQSAWSAGAPSCPPPDAPTTSPCW